MTAPLEWQPLWDAMDAKPDEWIPTTEAMYYRMLEVVPPRAHSLGAFLVGETYSARYLTVEQFRSGT